MKNQATSKRYGVILAVIAALISVCVLCFVGCADAPPQNTDGGTVTSIAVTKQPNKTEYEVGDKFSRSGMRVTAYYADGTEKTVLGYKIDKDGPLTLEDTVITVTYQECTATVNITVREKTVATQLTVTSAEFHTYKVEAEDCELASEAAGGDREAFLEYHNDNENNPNTSGGVSLGKLNNSGNSISLKINSTVEATIELIASLSYNPSLDFDASNTLVWNGEQKLTGWTVERRADAEYDWFDWQEYSLKNLALKVGINELAIKINGLTANYDYFKIVVSPIDSEPVSIAITTPPDKTRYIAGERFDPTGMVVTATYANGQTAPVNDYTYYVEPLVLGNDTVGIYFGELHAEVEVTVVERDMTLTSIAVDGDPVVKYRVGDYFNTDGLAIIATYADGFREYVTGWTVDKTAQLTEADDKVTVSFEEKTVELDITVQPIEAHATVENDSPRVLRIEAENAEIVYHSGTDNHNTEDSDKASGNACIGNMRGSKSSVKFYIDSAVSTVCDLTFTMAHPWQGFNEQAALYVNGVRDDELTLPWMLTGDWFGFKRFTAAGIPLKQGRNVVEIYMLGGNRKDGGIQFDCLDVSVNPLRGISATTPDKTAYTLGESFDPAGMTVTATYADGKTVAVTDYTVTPNGALSLADKKITIAFGGATTDVEITVTTPAVLTGISVTGQPDKTTYRSGEYFEAAGMVVTATYDDGSTSVVSDYEVTTTFVETGKPVTLSYEGMTAQVTVTVADPDAAHIAVDKNHTDYVLEFEDAAYTGSGYTLADATGNNPDASGGKWLDGFDGKPPATFEIVINSAVDGTVKVFISVASGKQGTAFDDMWGFSYNGRAFVSGIVLPTLAWHPNGAQSYVTSDALAALPLHKGYNYFTINIKAGSNVNMDCIKLEVTSGEIAVLQSIEVTTPPTKTEYDRGESFDPAGMVVTAHYSDGTDKAVTEYTFSPDTALTAAVTEITVSYDGKTAVTPITVTAAAQLTGITVSAMPTKTAYLAGEKFVADGMVVKATYDDGSEIVITDYTVAKLRVSEGDTFVTLNYEDKSVNVPVTVTVPSSAHITVTAQSVTENNGIHSLEFEDADFTPGATCSDDRKTLVVENNESSSGGKFLDKMDWRQGSTFEIRIHSEVESTAWVLLYIVTPNGPLDSMWDFEWNNEIIQTNIPATTVGWIPSVDTVVSSSEIGALPLHVGWNYLKITLKENSNVNMDFISIAVAPPQQPAEPTDPPAGDNSLPEAVVPENKGELA